MKKIKYALGVMQLLLITSLFAQVPAFEWAKGMGKGSSDYGWSIATDASGNVYSTGSFRDTVDFDPGLGVYNLISSGGDDIFISKLDASGNFVWAKKIGGSWSMDAGYAIAIDVSNNVCITGQFSDTVDFDPGLGIYNLMTNSVYSDIFICKLDNSGNFVWAKKIGAGYSDVGLSMTIDVLGNIYTTGVFAGITDFDPNAGVYNLYSAGSPDIFVSKLDASGNFVWARKMGGDTNFDEGNSIGIDMSNNVYITGYFIGTSDFNPDSLVTYNLTSSGTGTKDIFICKLDASGNFAWAKKIGGSSHDIGYSLKLDNVGNVYSTGLFSGTVDFDPDSVTLNLSSAGSYDVFVTKFDPNGNLLWAKNMGGASADIAYSMAIDSLNNIYTTGYFVGTSDFDPNSGSYILTSSGSQDVFISKLDVTGNFVWAKNMGGTLLDRARSIYVDAAGNVYTTGVFNGTSDFDPDVPVFNLVASGLDDIFIQKMSQPSIVLSMSAIIQKNEVVIYPNPTNRTLFITNASGEKNLIQLFDVTGKLVMQICSSENEIKLDVSGIVAGMYFLKIESDKNSFFQKIIKE